MSRRDEEIFRKLKKEKPLLKRKNIQPLSAGDFRKSDLSLDRPKVASKRVGSKPNELNVFSAVSKSAASPKQAAKRGASLASRYNRTRQSDETQPELSVFTQEERLEKPANPAVKTRGQAPSAKQARTSKTAAAKSPQADGLSIFTEQTVTKKAPQVLHADRGYSPSAPMMRVDQHDFDYLQVNASHAKPDFRHELKYYINYHDYVLLKNTIKALLSIDHNANTDGHYHIRSLYFDDVYETALKDKVAGTDERSKYRVRIYNYSDSVIKFEKKIKRGQFISKVSIGLSRDECDSIIAGNYDFLAVRPEPLASEIYLQMKNNALKPRVIVDYWREAYVSPFENVRVTFDKDIKGGLWLTDIFNAKAPTMPMLDEGVMVLEVKFNRYMPEFIKTVLSNVNAAQRSAISKYVLCRKFD